MGQHDNGKKLQNGGGGGRIHEGRVCIEYKTKGCLQKEKLAECKQELESRTEYKMQGWAENCASCAEHSFKAGQKNVSTVGIMH